MILIVLIMGWKKDWWMGYKHMLRLCLLMPAHVVITAGGYEPITCNNAFDLAQAVSTLNKHVDGLMHIREKSKKIFSQACDKVGNFFAEFNYQAVFKHPLIQDCITQIKKTKSIDHLFKVWRSFIHNSGAIEDPYLFIEDFSRVIFIVYHNLMECIENSQ